MEKNGTTKMIFSSSASVYGNSTNDTAFSEESPLDPQSPYAASKQMCGRIMKDFAARPNNSGAIISLRYFNPVGRHFSPPAVSSKKNGGNLFQIIESKKDDFEPTIHIFGTDYDTPDGTAIRDYIHIDDLVDGHICAIQYLDEMKLPGYDVINLGTENGQSVRQVMTAVQKYRPSFRVMESPRRPGDVGTCISDCSKAKQVLNWKATKSLDDMCRNILL
jgi:UDP-glucose 4-epimerase